MHARHGLGNRSLFPAEQDFCIDFGNLPPPESPAEQDFCIDFGNLPKVMDVGTIFYAIFALSFIGYSLLITMRTFAVSIAESNLENDAFLILEEQKKTELQVATEG